MISVKEAMPPEGLYVDVTDGESIHTGLCSFSLIHKKLTWTVINSNQDAPGEPIYLNNYVVKMWRMKEA